MKDHSSLVIGEGRLKIVTVHGEGKHGILIRPMNEAREVNSIFEGECGTDPEINEDDVVIWAANLEGVRVLQDCVNTLALFMDGLVVHSAPKDWDPRTHELVRK